MPRGRGRGWSLGNPNTGAQLLFTRRPGVYQGAHCLGWETEVHSPGSSQPVTTTPGSQRPEQVGPCCREDSTIEWQGHALTHPVPGPKCPVLGIMGQSRLNGTRKTGWKLRGLGRGRGHLQQGDRQLWLSLPFPFSKKVACSCRGAQKFRTGVFPAWQTPWHSAQIPRNSWLLIPSG